MALDTMKAATYSKAGAAADVLTLVDRPIPAPGTGEVRVRLAWSGVNPSDVKIRSAVAVPTLPFPRITPHSDGAGVIDAVGAGVPETRVGERVWLWNAAWGRPDGTAAQFVTLPSRQAVRLPDRVDLAIGACLGIPALTAYRAVTMDGGVRGRHVLITGGAGAVGQYAIQMAKLEGARQVIATVSGPEKAALARAAGADLVINYRTEDVAKACLAATGGIGVDRVVDVDFSANVLTSIAAVRPHGDIVVYGSGTHDIAVPFRPAIRRSVRLLFFSVYELTPEVRQAAVDELTLMLERDQLIHTIAVRLPLNQIVRAHEIVEQGAATGNVVLETS